MRKGLSTDDLQKRKVARIARLDPGLMRLDGMDEMDSLSLGGRKRRGWWDGKGSNGGRGLQELGWKSGSSLRYFGSAVPWGARV